MIGWLVLAVYLVVAVQLFRWHIRVWHREFGEIEIWASFLYAMIWPLIFWLPFILFDRDALFENPPPRRPGRDPLDLLAKWAGVRT